MSGEEQVDKRVYGFLERVFPGMGWRPLWMTVCATWALVIYYHHGQPQAAPDWFLETGRRLTGIENASFLMHGWAHLSALAILFIVPLGICRLFIGLGPGALGLRVRGAGREFRLVFWMWLAFIPAIWLFSGTESFSQTYPRLTAAETDLELFFLYQSFYLVKWASWEFFFRGFMLFGFMRDFGARAVLVSTIPFTLMHVGKPEVEMISALPAGLILCFIALRSKSIWPGVFLHSMVATTMDFFASSWWR